MSQRYKGAIISATPPTTSTSSASGEWTLAQQAQAQGASAWPVANPDPYFNQVSLLLHGDGTNGGQNNTFLDSSPPSGYDVSFDGSGDYLTIPYSTTAFDWWTSDFTIEAWVNPTLLSDWSYTSSTFPLMVGNMDANAGNIYWSFGPMSTGVVRFYYYNGSTLNYVDSTATVSEGQWSHVAATKTSSGITIWVNGVGNTATAISGTPQSSTGSTLTIGQFNGSSNDINGYVSNLRIVKGTAVYTSSFTPYYGNLTAITGTQLLTCQSASIVDNSPNAFPITVNGGATVASPVTITRYGNTTQGTFSPFSQAAGYWSNYFDGTGDYETVDYNTALNLTTGSWTVECWVYLNTVSTVQYLFGITSLSTGYGQAAVATNGSGALYALASTDGSSWINASTGGAMTANSWSHIAFVRNGTSFNLYLNGVSVISYTSSANLFAPTGTEKTYIANYGGLNYSLNGYMSNFRLVKGTAVYTSNFTPSTTPLTAITNTSLLTCQSNRFVDNSSNNFTITPAGDTKVTAWSPFIPALTPYSTSTNGGSGYFDGSGDYLSIANSSAFNQNVPYTYEAFVYPIPTKTGSWVKNYIYGNGGLSGYWQLLYNNANKKYEADVSGAGLLITSTNTFEGYQWHHVALCYDGTTTRLFINGTFQGSYAGGGAASAGTQYIGYYPHYPSPEWVGYISNFRFVASALYTSAFTPPTAPLTSIANTSLLLNCTNAAIYDNAIKNDVETVGNAQISTSVKKYGTGSMAFDGAGDSLKLPFQPFFNFGTGNFTIEGWFYFNSILSDQQILTGYSSSGTNKNFAFVMPGNGTVVYYLSSVGSSWDIASAVSMGSVTGSTWIHIALVRNGSLFTPYINGVAGTSTTNSAAIYSANSPLIIGTNESGGSGFNGYLDEFRITNGVARYTANFVPPIQAFPDY